jgi:WhiB family transcriptional regulator, redox-sensing transcriptional regulator
LFNHRRAWYSSSNMPNQSPSKHEMDPVKRVGEEVEATIEATDTGTLQKLHDWLAFGEWDYSWLHWEKSLYLLDDEYRTIWSVKGRIRQMLYEQLERVMPVDGLTIADMGTDNLLTEEPDNELDAVLTSILERLGLYNLTVFERQIAMTYFMCEDTNQWYKPDDIYVDGVEATRSGEIDETTQQIAGIISAQLALSGFLEYGREDGLFIYRHSYLVAQSVIAHSRKEDNFRLVVTTTNWRDNANCLGVDPSTRDAKELCRGCGVRGECLEYALDEGEKHGIWGGLSERERRRTRRRSLALSEKPKN